MSMSLLMRFADADTDAVADADTGANTDAVDQKYSVVPVFVRESSESSSRLMT